MATTTPYWGHLPSSTSSHQSSAGRPPDQLGSIPDRRRQSFDGDQPQPSQNRISVQTTSTDAPTESTLSPFATPTRTSFLPDGLAPRPPSIPYASEQYPPPEFAENRRRRRSSSQENDYTYESAGALPPPAAPDVPRAPPVSYRYPGGLPYKYPTVGGGPPPPSSRLGGPINSSAMASEYGSVPPAGSQSATAGRGYSGSIMNPEPASPAAAWDNRGTTAGRSAAPRDMVNGRRASTSSASAEPTQQQQQQQRRSSQGQQSGRRKFADDRSPLQRLEVTLGSITKEEKRARVEAAERAARERERAAAQQQSAPPQAAERIPTAQQVRFSDMVQGPPAEGGRSRAASISASPQASPASQRERALQNAPRESSGYNPNAGRPAQTEVPPSRIPKPSSSHASGGLQRNLSFRERAAKNDVKLPSRLESDSPVMPSPTTPTGGLSLTRSGSNKLQKEPLRDPWANRSAAAEKYIQTWKTIPGAGPSSFGANRVPDSTQSAAPPGNRPIPAPEAEVSPPASVTRLTKGQNQSKADRILGRTLSQNSQTAPEQARPGLGPAAAAGVAAVGANAVAAAARPHRDGHGENYEHHHRHHISDFMHRSRENLPPDLGLYRPPTYLDEWKNATVGTLSGALLDLSELPPSMEKDKAWWETSSKRGGASNRPRTAEAFVGEYDDANGPTKFRPLLHLKCGPLLRFCGIRKERTRSQQNGDLADREIWRGTVMIVTEDAASSYDIAPTLRLFAQPIELLPPPPAEIRGEEALAPEYVDPIAGHPKLGRNGETLYVRPVDHLEEAVDLSKDETDSGLFEKTRSPPDMRLEEGVTDPPGSFAARIKRGEADGEKVGKYKNIRGFRLHAERGFTFWRFNIEVELGEKQQRIAYRINRGPATGFWVPARGVAMNIMFHSCNGFSLGVDSNQFSGPDPMWRDVLNTHQSRPFHVMIGGGDQIYMDAAVRQTKLFQEWSRIKNPVHKHNEPFTPEMQDELEAFFLDRYSMWFSQGLFGMANSQIPMVNMYDDHDIIDGFGSYPHRTMKSPVFSGLGNVAFKYYMLFQHQSVVGENEETEPSWILGTRPGPYINELSRSLFMSLGSSVALLAVDARTERMREEVIGEETWKKIMDRCDDEMKKCKPQHLLVLLGVPMAYPRLVWLENILTSRLMDPVKALGKTGMLGNFLNKFDGGVEVLDDLDDHWTAKCHKHERRIMIEDLQDLAADRSVRVTILSGDVHLAAVGQFYSNPKLGLPKHKDFRYIPNIISSAIVNTPPPDIMADVLNKRNKVHHFDKETDEDMIPLFAHGVDGKPRNNKRLLPHRNWCSIREYVPGNSPPPTPPLSAYDESPLGTPSPAAGYLSRPVALIRRLSESRRRGPTFHGPDATPPPRRDDDPVSRPPLSGGGLFRSFSRSRPSPNDPSARPPLSRTLSLGRGEGKLGSLIRRLSTSRRGSSSGRKRPDDGGINGQWGDDDDDDESDYDEPHDDYPSPNSHPRPPHHRHNHSQEADQSPRVGLRGGGGDDDDTTPPREFESGDESYFSVRVPPRRAHTLGSVAIPPIPRGPPVDADADADAEAEFEPRSQFHRTPTGLSGKKLRKRGRQLEVNLEGGLEVCLNVEVNQRDPAGITVPYRLIVPRLWYVEGEDGGELGGGGQGDGHGLGTREEPQGIKRFFSLRRRGEGAKGGREEGER